MIQNNYITKEIFILFCYIFSCGDVIAIDSSEKQNLALLDEKYSLPAHVACRQKGCAYKEACFFMHVTMMKAQKNFNAQDPDARSRIFSTLHADKNLIEQSLAPLKNYILWPSDPEKLRMYQNFENNAVTTERIFDDYYDTLDWLNQLSNTYEQLPIEKNSLADWVIGHVEESKYCYNSFEQTLGLIVAKMNTIAKNYPELFKQYEPLYNKITQARTNLHDFVVADQARQFEFNNMQALQQRNELLAQKNQKLDTIYNQLKSSTWSMLKHQDAKTIYQLQSLIEILEEEIRSDHNLAATILQDISYWKKEIETSIEYQSLINKKVKLESEKNLHKRNLDKLIIQRDQIKKQLSESYRPTEQDFVNLEMVCKKLEQEMVSLTEEQNRVEQEIVQILKILNNPDAGCVDTTKMEELLCKSKEIRKRAGYVSADAGKQIRNLEELLAQYFDKKN